MRIDSSVLGMESARRYTSSTTRSSRFGIKDYSRNAANGMSNGLFGSFFGSGEGLGMGEQKGQSTNNNNGMASMDKVEELKNRVDSMRNNRLTFRSSTNDAISRMRQQTMRSLFYLLFGSGRASSIFGDYFSGSFSGGFQPSSGTSLVYSNEQYYEETESTYFSTKGIVKTADGREIEIDIEVGMSRRFTSYFKEELELAQIKTCDPLVLNFDGNAAELTDQKFYFDIDGDGIVDEISQLGSGSGYLALDKNGDGVINDGNELFGPQSGNGFADLAKYDADGNGWIDENDPIWSMLKIWCKNPDGTDTLYTLAEKGVGAICLQNAATEFSLNNNNNQTNGIIRSTGIFLYENGNVGTVQHLDVAR